MYIHATNTTKKGLKKSREKEKHDALTERAYRSVYTDRNTDVPSKHISTYICICIHVVCRFTIFLSCVEAVASFPVLLLTVIVEVSSSSPRASILLEGYANALYIVPMKELTRRAPQTHRRNETKETDLHPSVHPSYTPRRDTAGPQYPVQRSSGKPLNPCRRLLDKKRHLTKNGSFLLGSMRRPPRGQKIQTILPPHKN